MSKIDPKTKISVDDDVNLDDPKVREMLDKFAERAKKRNKQGMRRHILDHRMNNTHKGGGETQNKTPGFTYKQLRDYLHTLTEEQLSQQVQILPPHEEKHGEGYGLEPVIAGGTLREMVEVEGEAVSKVHSSMDYEYYPDEVVLLRDSHPYGEGGDEWYTMKEVDGEIVYIGNKTGQARSIIKRKPGEPSIKASRCPHMQPKWKEDLPELEARLEELCTASLTGTPLSPADEEVLEGLQAELYRRIYRLRPKEKKE